jgi:hypothetical protein
MRDHVTVAQIIAAAVTHPTCYFTTMSKELAVKTESIHKQTTHNRRQQTSIHLLLGIVAMHQQHMHQRHVPLTALEVDALAGIQAGALYQALTWSGTHDRIETKGPPYTGDTPKQGRGRDMLTPTAGGDTHQTNGHSWDMQRQRHRLTGVVGTQLLTARSHQLRQKQLADN